jgi:uncharacterized membrane protein YoaK (UPF0700 family)
MHHHSRPLRALAIGLSALAGFIDAVAFLDIGGFFVSFMSGNSTRLGVGLAMAPGAAATAGALIGAFVVGVTTGSLIGHLAGRHRRTAVLVLVATAIILAALLRPSASPLVAALMLAAAMGAANAAFERNGEVAFGVTYMTGALVKLGHRLALALRGGDRWAWLPYLLLWSGLAGGAWAGALAYSRMGFGAVWLAAALAGLFALAAAWLDRADQSTATV